MLVVNTDRLEAGVFSGGQGNERILEDPGVVSCGAEILFGGNEYVGMGLALAHVVAGDYLGEVFVETESVENDAEQVGHGSGCNGHPDAAVIQMLQQLLGTRLEGRFVFEHMDKILVHHGVQLLGGVAEAECLVDQLGGLVLCDGADSLLEIKTGAEASVGAIHLAQLCPQVIPVEQGIYSCAVKVENCAFDIHGDNIPFSGRGSFPQTLLH